MAPRKPLIKPVPSHDPSESIKKNKDVMDKFKKIAENLKQPFKKKSTPADSTKK